MYRLRFINIDTQDVLREFIYKKLEVILRIINELEEYKDTFILDNNETILKASYISNEVTDSIYNLYFSVENYDIQKLLLRKTDEEEWG